MNMDYKKVELTEGSIYKITSLGSRDKLIETEGTFKGFINQIKPIDRGNLDGKRIKMA